MTPRGLSNRILDLSGVYKYIYKNSKSLKNPEKVRSETRQLKTKFMHGLYSLFRYTLENEDILTDEEKKEKEDMEEKEDKKEQTMEKEEDNKKEEEKEKEQTTENEEEKAKKKDVKLLDKYISLIEEEMPNKKKISSAVKAASPFGDMFSGITSALPDLMTAFKDTMKDGQPQSKPVELDTEGNPIAQPEGTEGTMPENPMNSLFNGFNSMMNNEGISNVMKAMSDATQNKENPGEAMKNVMGTFAAHMGDIQKFMSGEGTPKEVPSPSIEVEDVTDSGPPLAIKGKRMAQPIDEFDE